MGTRLAISSGIGMRPRLRMEREAAGHSVSAMVLARRMKNEAESECSPVIIPSHATHRQLMARANIAACTISSGLSSLIAAFCVQWGIRARPRTHSLPCLRMLLLLATHYYYCYCCYYYYEYVRVQELTHSLTHSLTYVHV